ncbi:MAG: hypothetical protein JWL94_1285 [Microbacteriaceae bacterium]|jgi:hypothetical protein|nr:hypothetical protein [Microbacteriaceae bacterium]HEV7955538.1 hypothetical protein [Marisediminicola sp.]
MNESPNRDELPLPDYDHVPLAALSSRITALDEQSLGELLAYEREHGNRLPVTVLIEARLEAVRKGATVGEAIPERTPEVSSSERGSKVSPATSGPPINPPSQGVPTNPAQPR